LIIYLSLYRYLLALFYVFVGAVSAICWRHFMQYSALNSEPFELPKQQPQSRPYLPMVFQI
jgi:cytoskeletal protein RodZ